mmetsp:Transcript_148037/g.258186  ORF Transcript_148037/g.258186 Transcript_148037/m.258186 type:complete len:204 (+) Transcript_148037:116-727(+)
MGAVVLAPCRDLGEVHTDMKIGPDPVIVAVLNATTSNYDLLMGRNRLGSHRRGASFYEQTLSARMESHLEELFRLQDLKSDGLLEEDELIKLNEKIAMLHHGKDVDRAAVKRRYSSLFRERLDPDGMPVPYSTFRNYVVQVLEELDSDELAQEMILEQFIAEAKSARDVFRCPSFASVTDAQFMCQSFDLATQKPVRVTVHAL